MRESNKVWQPSESRIAEANITQFIEHINRQGFDLKNYADLHQWSLDHNEQFWQEVWLFCDVIGNAGETVKSQAESKWQQPVLNRDLCWFPDAHINYAENLLSFAYQKPHELAIWFENERDERQTYTWQQLCDEVSSVQQWLRDCGIKQGDVVAGYLPHLPQTVIAMLATTSLGATWTSTSPDFGVESVLERFGQVKPKILFTCDGYTFNGKTFDMAEKTNIYLIISMASDKYAKSAISSLTSLNVMFVPKIGKTCSINTHPSPSPTLALTSMTHSLCCIRPVRQVNPNALCTRSVAPF